MGEEKKKPLTRVASVKTFFEDVADLNFFGNGGLKLSYEPGKGELVVITGENATGKSFLRRIVHAALNQHEIELIVLSMQLRTAAGDIRKAFIYGDEGTQSTGQLSGHTVTMGMNTSRGRDKKHAVLWDARGHDRCWENDKELYRVLPDPTPDAPVLPPTKEEMLAQCKVYVEGQFAGQMIPPHKDETGQPCSGPFFHGYCALCGWVPGAGIHLERVD
jgi:hypothetical protein